MTRKPIVHHIPVCPFSQRLEILLALKGEQDAVAFRVVDITKPRDPELLKKARGATALPVLEAPDGRILKESLVILRYLDESVGSRRIRRADPFAHAIESMLVAKEGALTTAGYLLVMNQDPATRDTHLNRLLACYREIDEFLTEHNPRGTYLFDRFGLAEAVFAPVFMRFWFLDYYEGFTLPDDPAFERVRRWQAACVADPAARQVTREQIVKLYYDYALGAGNGALLPGRRVSSFAFAPRWQDRPWPPARKYGDGASDETLGLAPVPA